MIENYRTGFIWNLMKKNPYIRKGLEQAGFAGGWLNTGLEVSSRFSSGPDRPLHHASWENPSCEKDSGLHGPGLMLYSSQ